jgi:oxygen-independent coproporphyrinogen-3 oxidase
MALSLYIHIPFCVKRCSYCDFVSGIYTPEKAGDYIAALKREISGISDTAPLKTLYIGGGTPTALSADALSDLVLHICNHFECVSGYEATIEANPGTVDRDKLVSLFEAGINRLSMGVQSFSIEELTLLGRIHTPDEAADAVVLARDAGFKNIGIDLIYGIPGQTLPGWKATLEKTVQLGPVHISAYELMVEKGTELHEYLKEDHPFQGEGGKELKLPREETIIKMYQHTIDYLSAHGYIHYEISNFAKPGFLCSHNLNYWNRGEYFGAGVGAHSFIHQKRYYNTSDPDEYIQKLAAGERPAKGAEIIDRKRALAEEIFLGLRKTEGILIESVARRHGINILQAYDNEMRELQGLGLIEITPSGCANEKAMRLTRRGMILSNEVFAKFM